MNLLLWFLYFLTKPFYLFPSGLPQIADYLLVLLMLKMVFSGMFFGRIRMHYKLKPIIIYLLIFNVYVLCINICWSTILNDFSPVIFSLFYLFNFFVFLLSLNLFTRYKEKFILYTLLGVILSVFMQIFVSHFIGNSGVRSESSFNNPNQLGYYALLCVTIILAGHKYIKLKIPMFFGIVLSMYLAMISLSKAAILGIAMLLCIYMCKRPIFYILFGVTIFSAILILGSTIIIGNIYEKPFIGKAVDRIADIGKDSDDSLEKRGYDRIVNHNEYLLFGAGEGMSKRFGSAIEGEIHSSWGTLLFSYGIIGLALFIIYFAKIAYVTDRGNIILLIPTFFYGLTHQGLRFTFFWIMLAYLISISYMESNRKQDKPKVSY